MKELQDRVEHLQRKNDRLRTQVEKRPDLGKRDVQDSGQARHPTVHDKRKEPIIPDDVDTSADDEFSPAKSSRVKSR